MSPFYVYVCRTCKAREVVFQSMSVDLPEAKYCDNCKADSMRHKISAPAIGRVPGAGETPSRGSGND